MTTTTQHHPKTLGTFRVTPGTSRAHIAALWVATHLFIVGGSVATPVVLLAATSFIAWTRWSQR